VRFARGVESLNSIKRGDAEDGLVSVQVSFVYTKSRPYVFFRSANEATSCAIFEINFHIKCIFSVSLFLYHITLNVGSCIL